MSVDPLEDRHRRRLAVIPLAAIPLPDVFGCGHVIAPAITMAVRTIAIPTMLLALFWEIRHE